MAAKSREMSYGGPLQLQRIIQGDTQQEKERQVGNGESNAVAR